MTITKKQAIAIPLVIIAFSSLVSIIVYNDYKSTNGDMSLIFDETNSRKSPNVFLTTHACPDGYASHTVQYPTANNDSWVSSCSNQGVWIEKTFMDVDKMIPVSGFYDPVGKIGIMNHNQYGQFIEDFNSQHLLNLVPPLNITDGHFIKITAFQHYQPQNCFPSVILLNNHTIIGNAKLAQKIIKNQSAYGLTPMDYELTSNDQEACSTYATYIIEDLNSTSRFPITVGFTRDG